MKSIIKSIGYIIYFYIFQILVTMLFLIISVKLGITTKNEIQQFGASNILLITSLHCLLFVVSLIIFFKVRKKNNKNIVCTRKVGIKQYLLPVVAGFAYLVAFALITSGLQFKNSLMVGESVAYYSQFNSWLGVGLMVLALLIGAPISEEFICRGIMISE